MNLILRFAHTYVELIWSELLYIRELEGYIHLISTYEDVKVSPYVLIKLLDKKDDTMKLVENFAKRSVLLQSVYEIYIESKDINNLLYYIKEDADKGIFEHNQQKRYKYKFCHYKYILNSEERSHILNKLFDVMPHSDSYIDFISPEIKYIIVYNIKDKKWYFTKELYQGYMRKQLNKLSLKTRVYIGTTSMDPELSLIMCNMGKVQFGDIVYDPFAGTGSLLVASAFMGGYVMGSDIDGQQLRGLASASAKSRKPVEGGILANLAQYKLQDKYLGVFVCDFHYVPIYNIKVDAIITDPPYGIRAGAKKISSIPKSKKTMVDQPLNPRYPTVVPCDTDDIYRNLLDLAVRILKKKGRLVYWYPITDNSNNEIPFHPELKLINKAEQKLNNWKRCLITMELI